jgi:succinyl-diaminopimelate desuccinylase
LQNLENDVLEISKKLVSIPSQGGVNAPENVIFETLKISEQLGLSGEVLYENNLPVGVVIEVVPEGGKVEYALNAVIDTAPVGDEKQWTGSPFVPVIKDGKLYGRGTADSKTAAAIFLKIAQELSAVKNELKTGFVVFLDGDEHTGFFNGAKSFIKKYLDLKFVMIGYPGDGELCVGSRGVSRFELKIKTSKVVKVLQSLFDNDFVHDVGFSLPPKLTVTAIDTEFEKKSDEDEIFLGKAYHSGSSSSRGENAIEKAVRCALKNDKNIKFIKSGFGYSVIPDKARVRFCEKADAVERGFLINLDFRTTSKFDEKWALGYLKNKLEKLGIEFDLKQVMSWRAFKLAEDDECAQKIVKAIKKEAGKDVEKVVSGPSNIGNLLATHGVRATSGFGLGFENAHGTDEYIKISTIEPTYKVYLKAIKDMVL